MITVHHLEHSQSFRIVWLLEELEMEYELIKYARNEEKLAPLEYKSVSPTGTSPCITATTSTATTDTGESKLSLSESNAIMDYILDCSQSSLLRPEPGSSERLQYLFWFHTIQGTLQPVMTVDTLFRMLPTKVPWPVNMPLSMASASVQTKFILPRLASVMDLAEKQLESHNFLAGDQFTAADVCALYTFESVLTRYPDLSYPNCSKWLQRMYERPKFKTSQTKVDEEFVALRQ